MGPCLLEGHRTEEQKRQIAADINETDDDKLGHNIAVLEAWMKTQPHLPQNYDRRLLKGFLRGCKHNLEVSKRKLDAYFSIRNTQPEFFQNRNPQAKELQNILNAIVIAPLPELSPDGCRIIYHRLATDYDMPDLVRVILMMSDIRILEEPLVRGDIFVWDLNEFRMATLSRLMSSPATTKKVLMASQEAYPQRLQQIHLINCSSVAERLANLFKLFMKPKMKNRWFLHSSHSTLTKHLPMESIPKEYGGTAGSMCVIHDSWKQKLYDYSDWFLQQESIRTDESKRPADQKENKYLKQEVEGTFRQIQID